MLTHFPFAPDDFKLELIWDSAIREEELLFDCWLQSALWLWPFVIVWTLGPPIYPSSPFLFLCCCWSLHHQFPFWESFGWSIFKRVSLPSYRTNLSSYKNDTTSQVQLMFHPCEASSVLLFACILAQFAPRKTVDFSTRSLKYDEISTSSWSDLRKLSYLFRTSWDWILSPETGSQL